MKCSTFCNFFFSIVVFSFLFSCRDYESTSSKNWIYETTSCSMDNTKYKEPSEGQVGSWAFDKYVNENNPSNVEWRRNPGKDGQCDKNWVYEDGAYCSMSEVQYVAPAEGQTGSWAFDKYVNENNPADVEWRRNPGKDGQCDNRDDYAPSFSSTNITSGTYTSFTVYGQRIFATELTNGVLEYRNEEWQTPEGFTPDIQNSIFYPKMKVGANGKLFISSSKGVYFQTGDNVYKLGYQAGGTSDMAGHFGGSNTNFFVSAGVDYQGLFKWNESRQRFESTDITFGSFKSIEALSETQVFFGSDEKSNASMHSFGIYYYSGVSITSTNIETGSYSLAAFDNKMYAMNENEVLVWNGQRFVTYFQEPGVRFGKLKNVNNKLYLLASNGIYQYLGNSFTLLKSTSYENIPDDIVEHDNIIYVVGENGILYLKNGVWYELPDVKGIAAASSPYGLFIAKQGGGILKMIKN